MSVKSPLLSVIVANYNNAATLAECLDSILGQTFQDLEIVVYDDGSSDGSAAVLRRYGESRPGVVKAILDPVNRGAGHARHQAILASSGSHLTTLDSDDYYFDPRKLEKEMDLVRLHRETGGEAVLAFSNVLLVRPGRPDCVWGTDATIREGRIAADILGRRCFIPRDFVMLREAYFDAGGYDSGLPIYEDWDLKIRLAARHEFRYTGIVGTAYRRHGKGLSAAPPAEHRRCLELVFDKNIRLIKWPRRRKIKKTFESFMGTLTAKGE
jgi:glycosyltransferase involved in cell wall biosynthesis